MSGKTRPCAYRITCFFPLSSLSYFFSSNFISFFHSLFTVHILILLVFNLYILFSFFTSHYLPSLIIFFFSISLFNTLFIFYSLWKIYIRKVLRKEHGIVTSRPFRNYWETDQSTNQPTGKPSDQPTIQRTDMGALREVKLRTICHIV